MPPACRIPAGPLPLRLLRTVPPELGQQLREFRIAANLRGVDLAPLLGITQGQLSRIETGKRRIGPDQVQRWLEHTPADAETVQALVAQARQADTEVTAWKDRFGAGWDNYQKSYGEIERAATGIFSYQVSVIPGLLQAPGYTEFIQREIVGLTDDEVTAGLTAMRNRQKLLHQPSTRLSVVLAEHVLRHRFPGAQVMAEQLHRIAQLAALPTVELAVIPTDTDMRLPYMASAFRGGTGVDVEDRAAELDGDQTGVGAQVAALERAALRPAHRQHRHR